MKYAAISVSRDSRPILLEKKNKCECNSKFIRNTFFNPSKRQKPTSMCTPLREAIHDFTCNTDSESCENEKCAANLLQLNEMLKAIECPKCLRLGVHNHIRAMKVGVIYCCSPPQTRRHYYEGDWPKTVWTVIEKLRETE
jgi:hypothetical protein